MQLLQWRKSQHHGRVRGRGGGVFPILKVEGKAVKSSIRADSRDHFSEGAEVDFSEAEFFESGKGGKLGSA